MTERFVAATFGAVAETWLVLAKADVAPGPGGGPVFIPESEHETRDEAVAAIEAARRAAA